MSIRNLWTPAERLLFPRLNWWTGCNGCRCGFGDLVIAPSAQQTSDIPSAVLDTASFGDLCDISATYKFSQWCGTIAWDNGLMYHGGRTVISPTKWEWHSEPVERTHASCAGVTVIGQLHSSLQSPNPISCSIDPSSPDDVFWLVLDPSLDTAEIFQFDRASPASAPTSLFTTAPDVWNPVALAIHPTTGNIWIVKNHSTGGGQDVRFEEYNRSGTLLDGPNAWDGNDGTGVGLRRSAATFSPVDDTFYWYESSSGTDLLHAIDPTDGSTLLSNDTDATPGSADGHFVGISPLGSTTRN